MAASTRVLGQVLLAVAVFAVLAPAGCLVDSRCAGDADCPSPQVCGLDGRCTYECDGNADCGAGFECVGRRCSPVSAQPIVCPSDMVAVANIFCIDTYEASRPDATATSAGESEVRALSRPNVLPWQVKDNATAETACAAAGKRLCTPQEWELACRGPAGTVYGYGDSYEADTCNGIDTFGRDDLHLLPTGALETCVNGWGVHDINGNVWEHTANGSDETVRGGAYNCIDSRTLHRCDYIPRSWTPSALGFRCCDTPVGSGPGLDVVTPDVAGDVGGDSGGCLDPDTSDAGGDVPPDVTPPECTTDGECDDEDVCTDDGCTPEGRCEHTANTAVCDDGDACTQGDRCADGACIAGTNVCECEGDADCEAHEDGDLCNGTLHCDLSVMPHVCEVDPATIVSCTDPGDPCKDAECVPATGLCEEVAAEDGTACDDGDPCTGGDQCLGGECQAGGEDLCAACPADMVPVGDTFCMDRYEASRPDATDGNFGSDTSMATSREGVLPWFPVERATALAACEAAGKRLCTVAEWTNGCRGTGDTSYSYGNDYSATACNGIDAFCTCDTGPCADEPECPFPHCFGTCGAGFHVAPTGTFESCINEYGAFDVNGNVWELVDNGTTESRYKGGAYNCSDSEMLHACSYEAGTTVSARGFRCCRDQASGR